MNWYSYIRSQCQTAERLLDHTRVLLDSGILLDLSRPELHKHTSEELPIHLATFNHVCTDSVLIPVLDPDFSLGREPGDSHTLASMG
jgi:hypothetical protein